MKAFLALILMTSPTVAGQMYCNENLPYDVAEIPHGFAIVRMAYSDFCKQDHMSDDPAYICDGDSNYRLGINLDGEKLTLTDTRGQNIEFLKCD